jgi:hypothetical protein
MKLSIIARHPTWHTNQLIESGKKKGVEVEVVNVKSLNGLTKRIEQLGEVVLWRSSSLPMPLSRSVFIKAVSAKKPLFNNVIGDNPLVPYKFFQQKLVNPLQTVTGIPTYQFRGSKSLAEAIKRGFLKYPFVAKKNLSARGEGVYKITSIEQIEQLKLNFKDYIFQNFVKNDGDFRILVLGGVALGIIKRIKGGDEFRNNISLGGQAVDMNDLPETEDLKNKAVSLASKFGLQFCGVDFIYDQEEKIYRFMEINSVPQWQGFSTATGVDVAEAVIDYAMSLADRSIKKTPELVRDYYERFDKYLPKHIAFHFWSRLWLFGKDETARKKLDQLADWYLGKTGDGIEKRIKDLTTTTAHKDDPVTVRKRYYQKYPKLLKYGSLLFWWLMAREVYGTDMRAEVEKVAPMETMLSLSEKLLVDQEAIKELSSGATNFFYLLGAYSNKKMDTTNFFALVKNEKVTADRDGIKRVFYFLSHLLIGETYFYTRERVDDVSLCREIVSRLEKIIRQNYFRVSLDMKFEFLVCCRIVGYESILEGIIKGEAERSVSSIGNFLVDTHNAWIHGFGNKFSRAEHRNVLYLMTGCSI